MRNPKTLATVLLVGTLTLSVEVRAQVTYTNNFTTSLNYLTNGVAGTIWDGIYLGADEITDSTSISWIPDAASSGSLVVLSSAAGPIKQMPVNGFNYSCLLYTSDAADE